MITRILILIPINVVSLVAVSLSACVPPCIARSSGLLQTENQRQEVGRFNRVLV